MSQENLKYKTKKGIYWTFVEQFCNYGLQFIVGIIMARLLSPSDYGITALPAVFIVVAEVFINGGFGTAMVRKPELTEKDISTAFIYSISVGLLCYLILYLSAPYIAIFYNTPVLTPLIRVTALSFLWGPLVTPQTIILQRRLDFKTPARITIITKIIGAIIGICLAYMGYGLWSLVIMNVVSSFLSFVQTWFAVKWIPKKKWSRDSFNYLWGYGNKLILSSLLEKIYQNIIPIVLGKYFSTYDLGLYSRAKGYASLPAVQGTSIVQRVVFPTLSKQQDDIKALERNYRKMLKVTAFVIFPIMVLLSALARPLIIVMLTEKWEECVVLLQIICFSSLWYPIHVINLTLLQVKGRSDLFLKLEVIKKIIGICAIVLTLPFGLVVFCAAQIVISIISLIINTHYTGKILSIGFIEQMKDLLPTLSLSMLCFVIISIINVFIESNYLQIVVGIIIGTCIYVGGALIFKFSELSDVKYMINFKK